MKPDSAPASLSAERAIRFLLHRGGSADSTTLAAAVLSLRTRDETAARRVLETAFGKDPRLVHEEEGWRYRPRPTVPGRRRAGAPSSRRDPPYVVLSLDGGRPAAGRPFEIRSLAAIRVEEGTVCTACGGSPGTGTADERLRRAVRGALAGAVPVLHDAPGTLVALERWLGEPLAAPLSLRALGAERLGLPVAHDLDALAGRLGLSRRDSEDPFDRAETTQAVLDALRRPGESIDDLLAASGRGAPPVDWSRLAFGRDDLDAIPRVPGTYRFFDAAGQLLYVGKSKNLRVRVGSYFRHGPARPSRVQALLDSLHRIEVEPLGSDLEAVLREAAEIERRRPERNVQRRIRARGGKHGRLRSILILEPAVPPLVLRAYLLREGRLLARVGIGPRGSGLRRIERILEDRFFSCRPGPEVPPGPDVAVEQVARWLATNRDRVVAFDPTHLRSPREVILRLRTFLGGGLLHDPDGSPVVVR